MTILQRIRFLMFAAAALMFASAVLLAVVNTGKDNTRQAAHIDSLIDANKAKDAKASHERAVMLDGQRELQGKLDGLIAYFSSHGTYIPPYLLDRDTSNDNGDTHNDRTPNARKASVGGSGKQSGPKARPRPTAAASPLVDLGKVTKQVQDTAKDATKSTDDLIKKVMPKAKPKATSEPDDKSDKHPLRGLLKGGQ